MIEEKKTKVCSIYKVCKVCDQEKIVNDFNWITTNKDNRSYTCKSCKNTKDREKYGAAPKKVFRVVEGYKTCLYCEIEKPLSEFDKGWYRTKDGVQKPKSQCRSCLKEQRQARRTPKQKVYVKFGHKVCSGCGEESPLNMFNERKDSVDGYRGECKPCRSDGHLRWREANPEAAKLGSTKWAKENPERSKANIKRWREEHPEESKEHPEESKELSRRWAKENPEKMLGYSRKRKAKKKKALPAWFENEQVDALYFESAQLTKYVLKTHVDHIVPLQSDYVCGLHCLDNLRIIPAEDNCSKGNRWWPDMWGLNEF